MLEWKNGNADPIQIKDLRSARKTRAKLIDARDAALKAHNFDAFAAIAEALRILDVEASRIGS